MHIPDGFLAPETLLPAWAGAALAWSWAVRTLPAQDAPEVLVPRLALATALAYGLGLVMVPLPGGTSGHALGIGLLALLFGVRLAFLAYSLVLAVQALLFGAGGITALAVNALSIGLAGATIARATHLALRRLHEGIAVAAAAALAVLGAALLLALVLGAQPLLAQAPDGTPRFFPFGWTVTLPAVLVPHLAVAAGEAALTVLAWRYARARRWPMP